MGQLIEALGFVSLDKLLDGFDGHFRLAVHGWSINLNSDYNITGTTDLMRRFPTAADERSSNHNAYPFYKKTKQVPLRQAPNHYGHHYAYNSAKAIAHPANIEAQQAHHISTEYSRNSTRPQFLKQFNKNLPNQAGHHSQDKVNANPRRLDSPSRGEQKDLRNTMKSQNSEYQKMHKQLGMLQAKISQLSANMERRHQQKKAFLQNQRKQRQKLLQGTEKRPKSNKITDSLKKFVTQVSEGEDYVAPSFNPYSPRHNVYYVSQVVKCYKDPRSLAREHILMSSQYLKVFKSRTMPTEQEAEKRKLDLPKRERDKDKKTVVFDLDETLIHCNDNSEMPHDVAITIKFPTGQQIEAGINIRPHAVETIKRLAENFEIIVFTASHSCYANVVLDHLDPTKELVSHRLYREHCHVTSDGVYVKDLRVLPRPLNSLLLVDNAAYSYAYQLDNAIPIIPYYKGKNDFELKALCHYIESMLMVSDVRETNRKTFQLHHYCEFNDIDTLVTQLYSKGAD